MPRNQSIAQRNKNNKITSTEVPHPWEKLVTYKSNGDISEEYYMNPHTNATATTVREVISINFHEQGKKNAEKEVAKLMQTPEYQLHNHKTWDEINQMVVEERLDDTYLSTKKLVPENPAPDRRSLRAEAAGRSLRETAIDESEWLVEDLEDIGDRDQQVVPRITHLVDRLVDLLHDDGVDWLPAERRLDHLQGDRLEAFKEEMRGKALRAGGGMVGDADKEAWLW